MTNTLILLLGNRDIQISSDKLVQLRGTLYYPLFVENVDGEGYYVIDKAGNDKNGKLSFLDASKLIWNEYDYFIHLIRFELYEKTMQILEREGIHLDKVVITTSDQPQRHQQDCYFVALCLEKYLLSKGIACELQLCSHNPNNFDVMVPFYGDLFNKYAKEGSNLYISNTGGTPTMRSASHFAGLFQGYRYISIDSSSANESKVYQKQENQVLRQIVEKMLEVNDYQGIINLPVSQNVKDLCAKALNLYNFSISLTHNKNDYDTKQRVAIANLYWNMVVCFRQGRFADAAGRIFRLEECIGQLLLFNEWKDKGIVDAQGNVQLSSGRNEKPEIVFENKTSQLDIYKTHFRRYFREETDRYDHKKTKWVFDKKFDTNSTPFDCGKQFWYFFFTSLGKHKNLTDFFAKPNNGYKHRQNPLVELRNKSILGHGVEGINRNDLEKVTGDFLTFSSNLRLTLENELKIDCTDIFTPINEIITESIR